MVDDLVTRIPDLISAILLLISFWVLALIIRKIMRSAFSRSNADRDVSNMLSRIVFILFMLIGIFEALTQLKINLAALGIGVGLIGFGVGFAVKDILGNFLSGVLILLTRPFFAGDSIKVKEFEGTIESIEMRATVLRTIDGKKVSIPNSDIYTNPVTNYTAFPAKRMSALILLSHATDIDRARKVILDLIANQKNIEAIPAPDVLIKEVVEVGVRMEILYWCSTKGLDSNLLTSALLQSVLKEFAISGIELATLPNRAI
ncbi:MAG: mechanosensitive ion channel family protein [Chthonomonadales bacterium]